MKFVFIIMLMISTTATQASDTYQELIVKVLESSKVTITESSGTSTFSSDGRLLFIKTSDFSEDKYNFAVPLESLTTAGFSGGFGYHLSTTGYTPVRLYLSLDKVTGNLEVHYIKGTFTLYFDTEIKNKPGSGSLSFEDNFNYQDLSNYKKKCEVNLTKESFKADGRKVNFIYKGCNGMVNINYRITLDKIWNLENLNSLPSKI